MPSPTSITVGAPSFVLTDGGTIQATATVILSNGTTSSTGATFSGNAPTVATVSSTGVITPIAPGQVTVTATDGSQTGTATVRVVPDMAGTWGGTAVSVTCSGTGSYSPCDPTQLGGTLTVQAVLTQTHDQVSGTVGLAINGSALPIWNVTGTIAADGTLTLNDNTFQIMNSGVTLTLALQNWKAALPSAHTMAVTFSLTLSETDLTGSGTVGFTLSATKS